MRQFHSRMQVPVPQCRQYQVWYGVQNLSYWSHQNTMTGEIQGTPPYFLYQNGHTQIIGHHGGGGGGSPGLTTLRSVGIMDLPSLGGERGVSRYAHSSSRQIMHPRNTVSKQSTSYPTSTGCWVHSMHLQGKGLWGSTILGESPKLPLLMVVRGYSTPTVTHNMSLLPPGAGPLSQVLAPGWGGGGCSAAASPHFYHHSLAPPPSTILHPWSLLMLLINFPHPPPYIPSTVHNLSSPTPWPLP